MSYKASIRYRNFRITTTVCIFWIFMTIIGVSDTVCQAQSQQSDSVISDDTNIYMPVINHDASEATASRSGKNYSASAVITVTTNNQNNDSDRQIDNDIIYNRATVGNAEDYYSTDSLMHFANEVINSYGYYESYVNYGHVMDGGESLQKQKYPRQHRQQQQQNVWVVSDLTQRQLTRRNIRQQYVVSNETPIHILFPLPKEVGRPEVNPFGITLDLAEPVVHEAVDEVYRRQLVPDGSLRIHLNDSKLSDAHGPNVAIDALVKNQLDCIIGYAFVYALAPVARMSPYWRDNDSNGIPVITSIGLTSNLDNRREYQLMTRISSPYKVVKNAVLALFEVLGWRKCAYIFHDQRYDNQAMSVPYGECYLLMASIQPYLHRINNLEHNYFMFNEARYNKERMYETLKKASSVTNGKMHIDLKFFLS